jgi:iron complex transport system substrate-binding protein
MTRHRLQRLACTLCAVLCLVAGGCEQVSAPPPRQRTFVDLTAPPTGNLTRTCDAAPHAGWDYFPEKVHFEHSTQLRVEYHDAFKIVTFTPAIHRGLPLRYVLYQCGTPRPSDVGDGAIVVEVPVQRAVLNDSAYGGAVDRLGILDRLYGVNGFEEFTNPAILDAAASGRLQELGTRGPSTIEKAVALDIDVVFLFYSANPNFNLHPALARLGVAGVGLADLFESTPLGRAEWVKFLALFFNEEARANQILDAAAQHYGDLRTRAQATAARPVVFQGFPADRDTWTAVGGANAMATLIRDAGGRYVLDDDTPRANVPFPFERALFDAFDAPIWIGMNGVNRTKATRDLIARAPQVAELGPVRGGAVYAMDRHMNAARAFPFASESLDKPDVVLADLVAVLHPDLLPGYVPAFMRKLD